MGSSLNLYRTEGVHTHAQYKDMYNWGNDTNIQLEEMKNSLLEDVLKNSSNINTLWFNMKLHVPMLA